MFPELISLIYMKIRYQIILPAIFLLVPWVVAQAQKDDVTIYIVQEAWHTGIILPTQAFSDTTPDALKSFHDYQYMDIGWGDRDFYQTPGFPVWHAFKAIFWPTQAVLRIMTYNGDPARYYSKQAQRVTLVLTRSEFNRLCSFIADEFMLDDEGNIIQSRSQRFYLAHHKYSLFRTCNTWVANALHNAGVDIRSFMVIWAVQLFNRLEKSSHAEK